MPLRPRIVAVIAAGRLVHLTDAEPADPFIVRAAQGGCGGVSRLILDAQWPALAPRYRDLLMPSAPGSGLDRFGAALLGYDAFSGERPALSGGHLRRPVPDWRELTRDPRKYGFHATLKAPMALAPGKTEAELLAACEAFAATPRQIPVIRPVVNSISGFIAVVPTEPPAELQRLAADCVTRIRLLPRAAHRRKTAHGAIPPR